VGSLFKCKWHGSIFNDIPPREPHCKLVPVQYEYVRIWIWPIWLLTCLRIWTWLHLYVFIYFLLWIHFCFCFFAFIFMYLFIYFLLSFSAYDKVPISTIHLRKTEIQRQGRQWWCYEIISFKRQNVIATKMYSNIFSYGTGFVSAIEWNHCKFFTQVHLICINFS